MPTTYISIGGNIEPKKHISNAIEKLQSKFHNFVASDVYESKAVGFEGDNFLNLVVQFDTDLDIEQLYDYLHELEAQEGRERPNGKAWDSRTLDLDILLYGDKKGQFGHVKLPNDEILQYAHVFLPLIKLSPNIDNPENGELYADQVDVTQFADQQIWAVEL